MVFLIVLISCFILLGGTPASSPNWVELIPPNGIRFTPRNGIITFTKNFTYNLMLQFIAPSFFPAHATAVFKGRIYLTGGRTNKYTTYNLLDSYKMGDVWYSVDGGMIIVTHTYLSFV
jgi:hypothetical protein